MKFLALAHLFEAGARFIARHPSAAVMVAKEAARFCRDVERAEHERSRRIDKANELRERRLRDDVHAAPGKGKR